MYNRRIIGDSTLLNPANFAWNFYAPGLRSSAIFLVAVQRRPHGEWSPRSRPSELDQHRDESGKPAGCAIITMRVGVWQDHGLGIAGTDYELEMVEENWESLFVHHGQDGQFRQFPLRVRARLGWELGSEEGHGHGRGGPCHGV